MQCGAWNRHGDELFIEVTPKDKSVLYSEVPFLGDFADFREK